ncbi:uncharacterized protein CELE_F28B12.1 [Caenorhabditis elegans]|uniref:Uncharacterized protein n=2 Tax=Caenorhabditis elegans TaxID=6239 RepID=A0A2C9C2Z9_CAEEL|nr:Uncharacterized protein CELE_F28B12.1 [Caenorhabditis elegans]SOF58754.1 Uncharacterized protein CELE_F28B12.1 [Caenorhabditis elegans]|eukprot:NP_001343762.1 Uncharacterized protein CELE_F28B12.1 [Caenorhabditis elegans]
MITSFLRSWVIIGEMDFGGRPPPPMDDTYFPSLLKKDIWSQIENNTINFPADIRGWLKKLTDEKDLIDNYSLEKQPAINQWFAETDFVIRTLRCVNLPELVEHYEDQLTAQKIYLEKIDHRSGILKYLIERLEMAVAEEENKIDKQVDIEKEETTIVMQIQHSKKNKKKSKNKK